MTGGAVSFHGLCIAWTAGLDPVARLLAAYPADTTATAALTFHAVERPAPADDFHLLAAHEGFASYARDGEFLLRDGEATVRVAADGRRIDVADAAGARDEFGFVESTLLIALALALAQHGFYYLHAGAVVRSDGRRVLVVGESGAGKSTVTLALLEPGARVLGDDTVFFAARDGGPRVLGFARPFHLGAATYDAHASLLAGPVGRRGKRAVPMSALPVERAASMDGPDLILFPEIADVATTEALPLEGADAFGLALQSTAALARAGETATATVAATVAAQLDLLARLLANARAWRLRLGADALKNPRRIAETVASLP